MQADSSRILLQRALRSVVTRKLPQLVSSMDELRRGLEALPQGVSVWRRDLLSLLDAACSERWDAGLNEIASRAPRIPGWGGGQVMALASCSQERLLAILLKYRVFPTPGDVPELMQIAHGKGWGWVGPCIKGMSAPPDELTKISPADLEAAFGSTLTLAPVPANDPAPEPTPQQVLAAFEAEHEFHRARARRATEDQARSKAEKRPAFPAAPKDDLDAMSQSLHPLPCGTPWRDALLAAAIRDDMIGVEQLAGIDSLPASVRALACEQLSRQVKGAMNLHLLSIAAELESFSFAAA